MKRITIGLYCLGYSKKIIYLLCTLHEHLRINITFGDESVILTCIAVYTIKHLLKNKTEFSATV